MPGKGRPPLLWDPALTQSALGALGQLPDLFTWYRAASRHLTYGLVAPHIPRQAVIPLAMVPVLEQARAYVASSLPAQMDAVIMTAFSQYRLDDLQAMPLEELLELYAHAEWSIRNVRGIQLQLVGPDGRPIGQPAQEAAGPPLHAGTSGRPPTPDPTVPGAPPSPFPSPSLPAR